MKHGMTPGKLKGHVRMHSILMHSILMHEIRLRVLGLRLPLYTLHMGRFVEFNVPIYLERIKEQSLTDVEYLRILEFIGDLIGAGWEGAVLNQVVDEKNVNQIKVFQERMVWLVEQVRKVTDEKMKCKLGNLCMEDDGDHFLIVSRFTIETNVKHFDRITGLDVDVVAMRPVDDKHLDRVIKNAQFDVLDVSRVKSLIFIRKKLPMCIREGIMIEIQYQSTLQGDSSQLYSFFGTLTHLFRFGHPKRNIILSNGSDNLELIRRPHDVACLPVMFGYPFKVGRRQISDFVQFAIEHGEMRRKFKGVIQVMNHSELIIDV